jgi:hypothetical protein
MRSLCVLKSTSAIVLLLGSISVVSAEEMKFQVCMGNGDGPSCQAGANASYTCAEYNAVGSGGAQTKRELGKRFCTYYDGGREKQIPFRVALISSRPGGECGWTLFTVTCLPATVHR